MKAADEFENVILLARAHQLLPRTAMVEVTEALMDIYLAAGT
jgi:hypothetical protein